MLALLSPVTVTEHDSLTVSALACHAADPGSNPANGDDFAIKN